GLVPDRDLRRQPNLLLKFRAKGLPLSPQIICAWKSPLPKHPLITIGGHHPDVVPSGRCYDFAGRHAPSPVRLFTQSGPRKFVPCRKEKTRREAPTFRGG